MKLIIDETNDGIRVDSYLADRLQDLSRSQIQKLIKSNLILINNRAVKSSYILQTGDFIELNDTEVYNKIELKILPENIPLNIIWEDENMAVINKPSEMLTHPTQLETSGTLVNALMYHYKDNLSDTNGQLRPGIIHRLDRNTSGLIMIAKNNKTHEYLVSEMKSKNFKKTYRAIVKGVIEQDKLIIDTPIGRHPTKPHKMAINGKDSKDSLSIIHVIKRFKEATHVDIDLITGRTHQIRVHLSSIGHPVYNDTLYGFGKIKIKTEEQVLQSYKLTFTKPFTDEKITLEIEPDEKFNKVLHSINY